jgi:hypothetical protein
LKSGRAALAFQSKINKSVNRQSTGGPMATKPSDLEARYQARLEQEVMRLREESRRAVEEFKRSFPPPSDAEIERLLYPELSEFSVELGGRRFALRELPALVEKKFLRLVEQKLPALAKEILAFDEHLGDDASQAFTRLLGRAGAALDLVTEACVLVLDPLGELGLAREFVQQHASTSRQLRIMQAQLLLNGGRDFLSRLLPLGPALSAVTQDTEPTQHPAARPTPASPLRPVGSNSSATRPMPSPGDSHSASSH